MLYRAAVLGLATTVVLGGCSLTSLRVPEHLGSLSPDEAIRCDSLLPVADTLIGGVLLALAGFGALEASQGWQGQNNREMGYLTAIPAGVIGLVYAGSAVYGYRRVRRCRRIEPAQVARANAYADEQLRKDAEPLIKQGVTSARAGDCERVRALAAETQWTAPDIYRLFIRDPEIAPCMKKPAPEPAQPTPPPPEPVADPEVAPEPTP